MSGRRTSTNALDNLKREARRWLKALEADVAEARARLKRALPDAPAHPTLRTIHHALARERGFAGWAILKDALLRQPIETERSRLVRQFLDNACPDHHVRGGPDHARARSTAMRLLARYPDIANESLATRIVCGDVEGVRRLLADNPALALSRDGVASTTRSGSGGQGDLQSKVPMGPKGWEPLHFLCFTRLPLTASNENALRMARLLLDHGASSTSYFTAGGSQYTPLVGAIGEGEEARPAHPQRDALVQLLLDRGANPYDNQVFYNVHFAANELWLLEKSYACSVARGLRADWENPDWLMLSMGGYGTGARWHLWIAITQNKPELAKWCLEHGANPNAGPAPGKNLPQGSLYEIAVRQGQSEIAGMLLQFGATPVRVELTPVERFVAICMRGERDAIAMELAAHPEHRDDPHAMCAAANADRVDVVQLLLDCGVSPNVANAQNERPLHKAAYQNSLNVARLLLARGADIDAVESNWGNTAMGAAQYAQHQEMLDLLAPLSSDVWELTYGGYYDRLRELFASRPHLALTAGGGHTPLMWLPPADESLALRIVKSFLAYGADPRAVNRDGMTAADRAERLGMFDVVTLLRSAAESPAVEAPVVAYNRIVANLLDAHEGDDVPMTIDDARSLVAHEKKFASWSALVDHAIDTIGTPSVLLRSSPARG